MKKVKKSARKKSSKTAQKSVKENVKKSSDVKELTAGDQAEIHPLKDESYPTKSFPGDFQKHAHRFTRSFSWKTKPEESSFAHMQPLPKLIKRPGYTEICCKSLIEEIHLHSYRLIECCRCLLASSSTLFMLWSKYG